jgi:hypothetical protein
MRVGSFVAVALALSIASTSLAQDPSWRAAEALVRAHFASVSGETLADVRARRDLHLGPVFWAQRTLGDGSGRGDLAFVRGDRVLIAHGLDGVIEVMRADDAVHAARWTALALFDVLREAGVQVPLPRSAWRTHDIRALRPSLVRHDDALEWTVYTANGGPPESPATPQIWVMRATLTLGTDYVPHWMLTDQHVDMHGRPLWTGEPHAP